MGKNSDKSPDGQVLVEYEARKKAEQDFINGMEGAYQQGVGQTVRNALVQGLSLDVMQSITGLSQEDIGKL